MNSEIIRPVLQRFPLTKYSVKLFEEKYMSTASFLPTVLCLSVCVIHLCALPIPVQAMQTQKLKVPVELGNYRSNENTLEGTVSYVTEVSTSQVLCFCFHFLVNSVLAWHLLKAKKF